MNEVVRPFKPDELVVLLFQDGTKFQARFVEEFQYEGVPTWRVQIVRPRNRQAEDLMNNFPPRAVITLKSPKHQGDWVLLRTRGVTLDLSEMGHIMRKRTLAEEPQETMSH
ncbi:MAG: hypothetical protein KBD16_03430 [Candidatus Pacebacteria bacterium]|nr:hypothetical protein [Candidatus Paceibacterota bacterium]